MKVYVLFASCKTLTGVLGVFSSHEKARTAQCKAFSGFLGTCPTDFLTIIENDLDNEPWYDDVAIWVMRDNHTFYKPTGKTPDIIINHIVQCWTEDPYCMVCSIRFLKDGVYVGEPVGKHVHGNGRHDEDNFMRELMIWRKAMVANPDIMEWLNKKDNI